MIKNPYIPLLTVLMFLYSGGALAHPGHDVSGLSAGLIHPLSGIDHLLAMLAVGLWAAQNRGRKIWILPTAFILMMVVGAKFALIYPFMPLIESGIAASVLALGVIIALSLRPSTRLSIVIASLFGLFHGYAHGLEMLGINEIQGYALGFVVTTAALHLAGIVTVIATRTRFVKLPQMLGGIITVSGVWLLSVT